MRLTAMATAAYDHWHVAARVWAMSVRLPRTGKDSHAQCVAACLQPKSPQRRSSCAACYCKLSSPVFQKVLKGGHVAMVNKPVERGTITRSSGPVDGSHHHLPQKRIRALSAHLQSQDSTHIDPLPLHLQEPTDQWGRPGVSAHTAAC
jgi:hypothetical protein